MSHPQIPNILTIAGSDPGGGAGIQADLKVMSALGTYGTTVITALTAQNTTGVSAIRQIDGAFITEQYRFLLADIHIAATKIGMIGDADAVRAVAAMLRERRPRFVVLDPVMIAKGGDALLTPDAVSVLRDELLPLADVVTPNLPEAQALLEGDPITTVAEMKTAARALAGLGPKYVYLKGGHLAGEDSPDVIFDGQDFHCLPARRIATKNTHGTGCSLSSAIAALLPQHDDPLAAMTAAKAYISGAIAAADQLDVGEGHGPIHHFHRLWRD